MIGASVTDKSAPGHGAVTDLDGHYSISVDQQAILTFSYIGYDAQDIAVDGRTVVDVVLKENETLLDEVVVIGYGTQNRSKMSSSVATISSSKGTFVPWAIPPSTRDSLQEISGL